MLGADVRDMAWLDAMPGGTDAIVVMEGISMYLRREELLELLHWRSGSAGWHC